MNLPTTTIDGKTMYLYFAYGSNLNKHQMEYRCPDAIPLGRAEVTHHKLLFRGNSRGFGVATIEREVGRKVLGGLWAVSKQDLVSLDRYEGYPRLYTRRNIQVNTDEGVVMAMTYCMHPEYQRAMPNRSYMDTIYEGYEDFGLNQRELLTYYKLNINEMEREENNNGRKYMDWKSRGI